MPIDRAYVIAQARMGSTRLPGKVMLPLAGRPVVEWVIRRAAKARVDGVVLAVPDLVEDDPLRDLAVKKKCTVYRGNADDVQARYLGAANAVKATTVVRLTCDNPFVDASLIDLAVESHRGSRADYTTFVQPYPLGFSVEVFSVEVLRRSREMSHEPYHGEHVTPAIYQHPESFRLNRAEPPPAFRRDDIRLTLDTQEDYGTMQALVALVRGENPLTVSAERYVVLTANHPEISTMNAHVRQKQLGE